VQDGLFDIARDDRQEIDDVERGANDSDWQPAKDAARQIAFAEDSAVFEGYTASRYRGNSSEDKQSENAPSGRCSPVPGRHCLMRQIMRAKSTLRHNLLISQ